MTTHDMLRELGYGTSTDEVSRFQRDHNKLSPGALLINGRLDETTRAAVKLAYSSSALFVAARDQKEW